MTARFTKGSPRGVQHGHPAQEHPEPAVRVATTPAAQPGAAPGNQLALAAKDREWLFWGVQQTLIFPLMILSGMLLPLDEGPAWMRVVAFANPMNWIVQAERALLSGDFANLTVAWGWLSALAVAVGGLIVGMRAMRRSN